MAWSEGREVMMGVLKVLKERVPEDHVRRPIVEDLVLLFIQHDCPDFDGCHDHDPLFAEAEKKVLKDYYSDDD